MNTARLQPPSTSASPHDERVHRGVDPRAVSQQYLIRERFLRRRERALRAQTNALGGGETFGEDAADGFGDAFALRHFFIRRAAHERLNLREQPRDVSTGASSGFRFELE